MWVRAPGSLVLHSAVRVRYRWFGAHLGNGRGSIVGVVLPGTVHAFARASCLQCYQVERIDLVARLGAIAELVPELPAMGEERAHG
ncbi:hypothetical protein GCM10027563_06410 [Parasphingorhabdus pacifica]